MSSPIGSSQGSTYPATSRRWSVLLVWWATCVLWSSVFLFIKMGVTAVPPLGFAALRLALAAGILVLFTLVRRQPWPTEPRDWMLISSTGVLLLGLNYGLLFWGTQFIPSGVTAVLQASSPAFSLVLAGLLGAERMTLAKVGGVTLGIAGVAIVCLDQGRLSGAWSLVGSVAVTAGAICVAIAYVGVKTYRRALNSTMLMAGQMISALVPLGIAALIKEGNPLAFNWTGTAIVSLLYLALAGSIVATWLNYWLLRRMDATSLLAMGFVEPFIAVLLGVVFLDERITLRTIAGGLAVTASVWLVLRRGSHRTDLPTPAAP
jgi:drug/metabolite transporter (DMT)-like permease